jgi:hypothetical protein
VSAQDPSGLAGLARLEHGFVPARVTALAALAGGRLATASNDPWTVSLATGGEVIKRRPPSARAQPPYITVHIFERVPMIISALTGCTARGHRGPCRSHADCRANRHTVYMACSECLPTLSNPPG